MPVFNRFRTIDAIFKYRENEKYANPKVFKNVEKQAILGLLKTFRRSEFDVLSDPDVECTCDVYIGDNDSCPVAKHCPSGWDSIDEDANQYHPDVVDYIVAALQGGKTMAQLEAAMRQYFEFGFYPVIIVRNINVDVGTYTRAVDTFNKLSGDTLSIKAYPKDVSGWMSHIAEGKPHVPLLIINNHPARLTQLFNSPSSKEFFSMIGTTTLGSKLPIHLIVDECDDVPKTPDATTVTEKALFGAPIQFEAESASGPVSLHKFNRARRCVLNYTSGYQAAASVSMISATTGSNLVDLRAMRKERPGPIRGCTIEMTCDYYTLPNFLRFEDHYTKIPDDRIVQSMQLSDPGPQSDKREQELFAQVRVYCAWFLQSIHIA